MNHLLNQISNLLNKFANILVVPFSAAFFILIFLNVLTRFVFRSPMLGVEDYSKTFFVWSCFLGASILFKNQEHISITGLVDKLPKKVYEHISFAIKVVELLFFVMVCIIGIQVCMKVHVTRMVATHLRMSVLYSALPVSMGFCVIHTLSDLANDCSKWKHRNHATEVLE